MSQTQNLRAGKRGNICVGNNVSATMCPRLPGPLRFVRARAYVRALVTQKSYAVGMRNAILRNYLKPARVASL